MFRKGKWHNFFRVLWFIQDHPERFSTLVYVARGRSKETKSKNFLPNEPENKKSKKKKGKKKKNKLSNGGIYRETTSSVYSSYDTSDPYSLLFNTFLSNKKNTHTTVSNNRIISGNNLKIEGNNNNITGNNLVVIGDRNRVKGNNIKVVGNDNTAIGNNIVLTGKRNTGKGQNIKHNEK